MDKLNLANIQALAASVDYGGSGFLQPASAALGLSAALFLSNLSLWQGASYSLTDAEIDDIQAMIAQLEEDLTNTGGMYPMNKCKVSIIAPQSVPNGTSHSILWNEEIYDENAMHSVVSNTNRINVLSAGLHLIVCNVIWDVSALGRREVRLYRTRGAGNTQIARDSLIDPGLSVSPTQLLVSHDVAEVGDYYQLTCTQTSGGILDLIEFSDLPFFAVVQL